MEEGDVVVMEKEGEEVGCGRGSEYKSCGWLMSASLALCMIVMAWRCRDEVELWVGLMIFWGWCYELVRRNMVGIDHLVRVLGVTPLSNFCYQRALSSHFGLVPCFSTYAGV